MAVRIGELRRELNDKFGFREFTRQEWRILVALVVVSNADWVSTKIVMFGAGSELNPLAGWFIERKLLWFPKFALPLVTAFLVARMSPSRNLERALTLAGFVVFIYAIVVVWNALQIF